MSAKAWVGGSQPSIIGIPFDETSHLGTDIGQAEPRLKTMSRISLTISMLWLSRSFGFFRQYSVSRSTILLHQTTSATTTRNAFEKVGAAGIASAAAVAAAAVNTAVGMKTLEAPDVSKTYVYRNGAAENRTGVVDEVGLPLVYNKDLIQKYWKKQGSALTQRWTEFLGYAVPYLTKVITLVVSGGPEELSKNGASLAKDARVIFEKLGPTYVKMGQMMSVRPDVLPKEALDELKILQDSVKPFDTPTAVRQIESELGGELGMFFSEISEEPVAAASLAQVYKARLITGEYVAVKIQRPGVLETVSKDLYVLRRAAEVYQGLIDRFAPQQRTDYVALLNEWAVGFYTELDFLNEAANQKRLSELLQQEGVTGVYVPKVYDNLCTRRVLVSEWIDGVKLSNCDAATIKSLIPEAQEAFLTQLLQVGFFHSDPHPGNILVMHEPRNGARMALIDFGLVAAIQQKDMDTMISAIIHLANKDYASLVDDFISLEILPSNCDRSKVVPLMDKALTPYVKGGGAKRYEEELRNMYGMDGTIKGTAGGFQAMTQDAITVLNDIPFSIPPYFALLGRAIVTLEGVALTGDPNYGIIMEAYPFVARKLLDSDRPAIQKALQEVLYSQEGGLSATRLAVLLNSALGVVAKTSGAFIDLDSIPKDAVSLSASIKFLLSDRARSLRTLLEDEVIQAGDILTRQGIRKLYNQISNRLKSLRPPFIGSFLPDPLLTPTPFLIPPSGNLSQFIPVFDTPANIIEAAAPKLTREEELYALSLKDLAEQTLGKDAAIVVNGDVVTEPTSLVRIVLTIVSKSSLPSSLTGLSNFSRLLLQRIQTQSAVNSHRTDNLEGAIADIADLSIEERRVLTNSLSRVSSEIAARISQRIQSL